MSDIGKTEHATQDRVIALFRDELGYRFLGNWMYREDNSNIDDKLLTDHLTSREYSTAHISRALYLLHTEADNAIATSTAITKPCTLSCAMASTSRWRQARTLKLFI